MMEFERVLRRMAACLILALLLAVATGGEVGVAQTDGTGESTPAAGGPPAVDLGPEFLIRPVDGRDGDYFTLEGEPGNAYKLTVVLANVDDESWTLRTYANDVVPIVNGGFGVAAEEIPAIGTATWIDYPAETFDFEPGNGVERTFTVTIPEDAQPGQYIAGLSLQTVEPLEVQGTSMFNQIIRKSIAVFIIVPGPEHLAFGLTEPLFMTDSAISRIELQVENTGNVLVKPAGELQVATSSGEVVMSAPVQMGSVYAGMTVTLSVGVKTPIPDGEYLVSVELSDEATGATASLKDVPMTVSNVAEAAAQFLLEGTVVLAPGAANPNFADVAVTITNQGETANAEVLLEVTRDGQAVETFQLAPSLSLPPGETTLMQRYIPPTGWSSGSWSFVLKLNVIDPSTGASTNVATLDTIPQLEVGE